MADYLNKVKQLKDAMDGVHASVLALTENDGTGADEFSIRLEVRQTMVKAIINKKKSSS